MKPTRSMSIFNPWAIFRRKGFKQRVLEMEAQREQRLRDLRAFIERDEDLRDLSGSGLGLEALQQVVDARITAREVIGHLEPHHVSGYADLIAKLEQQIARVRTLQRISNWRP